MDGPSHIDKQTDRQTDRQNLNLRYHSDKPRSGAGVTSGSGEKNLP